MYYNLIKLLLLIPVLSCTVFGQSNTGKIRYYIDLTMEGSPIQKGERFSLQGDTITVETCKMYLSNFAFIRKNNQVIYDNQIQLIDVFGKNYFEIDESLANDLEMFSFRVICDTTLKAMPPLSGQFSASEGMFWSWTNGFMALKMEGKHSSSTLPHKNYVFHLGALDKSYVPDVLVQNPSNTHVKFDLKEVFLTHSFGAHPSIMEIDELSINLLKLFSLSSNETN